MMPRPSEISDYHKKVSDLFKAKQEKCTCKLNLDDFYNNTQKECESCKEFQEKYCEITNKITTKYPNIFKKLGY
jgi:hypothetical protein